MARLTFEEFWAGFKVLHPEARPYAKAAWDACEAALRAEQADAIERLESEKVRLAEWWKNEEDRIEGVVQDLQAVKRLQAELATAKKSKDGAYHERDCLVAALSKLFPSSLERHPDDDTAWENDWRWIVFIDLPAGQATWHIHDSELSMFDHLARFQGRKWDGHYTSEKYDRLATDADKGGSQP